MGKRTTLRFKILAVFFVILTALIVFLFYLSVYAINLVRMQVSQSESKMLSLHVNQIDRMLEETKYYLLRLVTRKLVLVHPASYRYLSCWPIS